MVCLPGREESVCTERMGRLFFCFVFTLFLGAGGGDVWSVRAAQVSEALAVSEAEDLVLVQRGHMVHARTMAISPDGKILITSGGTWGMEGSGDATIKIWDLNSGRLLRSIVTNYDSGIGYVENLRFLPNGKGFVASGRLGPVGFFDLESGQRTQLLEAHSEFTSGVVFDSRGHLLTAGVDGTVRRWKKGVDGQWIAATDPFILQTPNRGNGIESTVPYRSLAIHPDGSLLAAGSTEGEIDIWDAHSYQFLRRIDLGEDAIETAFKLTRLSFHPTKDILVATLREKSLAFVNPRTGRHLPKPEPDPGIGYTRGAFYDPTGSYLAVLREDHSVALWDAAHNTPIKRLKGHQDRVRNGAFTPDGKRLVTTGFDSTLKVWDVKHGRLQYSIAGYDRYRRREEPRIDFSPDSEQIAVGTHDSRVLIWDLNSAALAAETTGIDEAIGAVSFRPGGRELVICDFTQYFFRWFPETKDRHLIGRGTFYNMAWSPDGSRLFACNKDLFAKEGFYHSTLIALGVADSTTTVLKEMQLGPSEAASIAMNPDGTLLAVAYHDGALELRDSETLNVRYQVQESHMAGTVDAVCFGLAGKSLVALAADGVAEGTWDAGHRAVVRIWKLGAELEPELVHSVANPWPITSVAYHPTQARLACALLDGYRVRFVDTLTGEWEGSLPIQDALVTKVQYSPDGKFLALAKANDSVSIWNTETSTKHCDIHLLPERQWLLTRPGRAEYNASTRGDEFAAIRLGERLNDVFPLRHYRDQLLHTQQLIKAWSEPAQVVPPQRILRWWEDAVNRGRVSAVVRLTGFLTFGFLGLSSLFLGLRSYRNRREAQQLRDSLYRQEQEVRQATERKNEELSAAKAAAEAADRAKSTFLGNLTHEIRTPLNAIVGFCQVLRRAKDVPQHHGASLVTIERSSYHLLNLIDDVLNLSKLENGRVQLNLQPFALATTLEDIVNMIRPACMEKEIAFGLEGLASKRTDLPVRLMGDDSKLRQVLMNLLGNAVKYTDVGSVTLRITEKTSGEDLECTSDAWRLLFEVIDTGPGISEEDQALLFTPFAQGDASAEKGGAGLGLAIAQRLLIAMGSAVQVESEKERGSRFSFDLVLPLPIDSAGSECDERTARLPNDNAELALISQDILNQLRTASKRCSLTQVKTLLDGRSCNGVPEAWQTRWMRAACRGDFGLITNDLAGIGDPVTETETVK